MINDKNNEPNKFEMEFNNRTLKEFQPGEEVIAVLFISINQKQSWKNSSLFIKIIEIIYEYQKTNNKWGKNKNI